VPYLEKFAEDQRARLVALPYRVGLWISQSDRSGDESSEQAEMIALESIITSFAEDFLKSEFVEELMRASLKKKAEWDKWRGGIEAVPQECKELVDIATAQISQKDALAFRENLMDVALTVAMAYREEEDGGGSGAIGDAISKASGFILSLIGKRRQDDSAGVANISSAEQGALMLLSRILDIKLDRQMRRIHL